jgi:hypothetical protein
VVAKPQESKIGIGFSESPITLKVREYRMESRQSSIHLVLDNPTAAKAVLDQQRADYTETEFAHVKPAHRPGELGRAAPRPGGAGININFGYCGTEAVANASILVFGGRFRCDSGVSLPEVCIDYAGDVLSEPLPDGEDLG